MSSIIGLILFLGWIYYIYKCVPLAVDTVNGGSKNNAPLLVVAVIGALLFGISSLIGVVWFAHDLFNGKISK